jgi:membrane carboxypeptidase/penicillin-binding protein
MIPPRIQWFGRGALIAGGVLFVAFLGFLIYLNATLPPVARLENPEFSLPTAIFDRHGTKVDEVFIYRRKLVTYNQVPQTLINGLLAKEDTRFFEHHASTRCACSRPPGSTPSLSRPRRAPAPSPSRRRGSSS